MIKTSIKNDFLDLFYHDMVNIGLENSNTLNAFTLKIRNNSFTYDELVESLSNQIYHFALSRTEVIALTNSGDFGTLVNKAKEKLRRYSANEGELGEILLYCLLETHLNAPKILTKLELKTAKNDYVKGADGVHLLKVTDADYQLILGESKLNSDLKKGIYEAFGSLEKLLNENKKLEFEIGLVNSQLVKEAFDDTLYQFLKKIIVPSAREDKTNMDYSFGIFLGFNVDITDDELKLPNSEYRTVVRDKIKKIIEENVQAINYQIKKAGFRGYDFYLYLYLIPFSDLSSIRKQVIQDLT